jgi:hypothetical protein
MDTDEGRNWPQESTKGKVLNGVVTGDVGRSGLEKEDET